MRHRPRRNPTGIDTNSALLGAGLGALAAYLLTRKSETAPSQMAYIPAQAPADEPWMRAAGYRKAVAVPTSTVVSPMYTVSDPLVEQYRQTYTYAPDPARVDQLQPTESYDSDRPRMRSNIPSSMLRWSMNTYPKR